jgi:hypothetical protein
MSLSINLFADFVADLPSPTAVRREKQTGLGWQPTTPLAMLAALQALAVRYRRLLRYHAPINLTAAGDHCATQYWRSLAILERQVL